MGAAREGGGGGPPSQTATLSGNVLDVPSSTTISDLGGAIVTITINALGKPSLLEGLPREATQSETCTTTTEADGSFTCEDLPTGTGVVTITKEGKTTQTIEVDLTGGSATTSAFLQSTNANTAVITPEEGASINTFDVPSLPEAQVNVPAGAVATDTDVVLTPYHTMNNLPEKLPEGYTGLAGAELATVSGEPVAFALPAEAYVQLPAHIKAEELEGADIRLLEYKDGDWVVRPGIGSVQFLAGSDKDFLGPDPGNTAGLDGTDPFVWAAAVTEITSISGTVTITNGTPVAGAVVFGGGATAQTSGNGSFLLKGLLALEETSLVAMNCAAPGYLVGSAFVAVTRGETTSGVVCVLQALEEVGIVAGKVTHSVTDAGIAGAKVILQKAPTVTTLIYEPRGTEILTDDILLVEPPETGVSSYAWSLTTPAGETFPSATYTSNLIVMNGLFLEAQASGVGMGLGAYRVDLTVTLAGGKTQRLSAGFLLEQVGVTLTMTDIELSTQLDPNADLESQSNEFGNYRLIGVPIGETLQIQASADGYVPSPLIPISPLTPGETRQVNIPLAALGAGDTTAPSVPTGLSATAQSSSEIHLTWNAATDNVGVRGYRIYRNSVLIAFVSSPSFTDTGLAASTTYTYTVAACDAAGNCSAQSAPDSATTLSETVPIFTLTVTKAGSGSGTVTSSPAGINCGTACSEPYASNTGVTLTATPASGSVFAGWSGACTGTGSCTVTMDAAKSVTATFSTGAPAAGKWDEMIWDQFVWG